jgi:hypothetical protein
MDLSGGVLWIGGGILLLVMVLVVMVVAMNGCGRGDTP